MLSTVEAPARALDETQTSPGPQEHWLTLDDSTRLFYRAWIPTGEINNALIVLHRGHEHSGRLADVVEELALEDTAVFAWDARGHGLSEGQRGYAPSFMTLVHDLDQFARHISETYHFPLSSMSVLGHSVGGVVATTWVHDYNPGIRSLILATPAFRVRLYVPFAIEGLKALNLVTGKRKLFVSSYVSGRMLTSEEEWARSYDSDPLVSRAIGVDVLLDMRRTADRLLEDAKAIRTPTLVLAGASDAVVDLDTERAFFDGLGSRTKRLVTFPGMRHDILHERKRDRVLEEIRAFLRFDSSSDRRPDARERSFTVSEQVRLSKRLSVLNPKAAWFASQRLFLRTVGKASEGVRLGWAKGFDSGAMLDYVYENRARGRMGIGRLIDRVFLESPGWRGIRERRGAVSELLSEAITTTAETHGHARVLDVACGGGRYVLDSLAPLPKGMASAVLCDLDPRNVAMSLASAAREGIDDVAGHDMDAFDDEVVASVEPRPTVAIVSGLYELFPSNAPIRRSLAGIGAALEPGGYLVYTGQPWHPQLEMIARVLVNRDGRPWVMRRRTQQELDDLVMLAGFEKVRTIVDAQGIFTVSLARKINA